LQSIDLPQLVKELNGLAEVFDKRAITDKAAKVWFDTLREFPTERVLGLLMSWPKTHGKFPTPAEVWKACNEMLIDAREEKARLERLAEPKWERSPRGVEFLAKMKRIINSPKRSPMEHWQHVMATKEGIGHEYAKQVLEKRKPQDDEHQAVNF
jgi:hypothetical protein